MDQEMKRILNPYKNSGIRPEAGKLLIAAPYLIDPNFARTVVLLCEHNHKGSVGFVLNRPTDSMMSDIMTVDYVEDFEVFEGGPVNLETLHIVHKLQHMLTGKKIAEQIYWGASFETLKNNIAEDNISPNDIKLLCGYSGWEAGQLQNEIKEGSWVVADAISELVFNTPSRDMWRRSLASLGAEYAYMANIPLHPQMN